MVKHPIEIIMKPFDEAQSTLEEVFSRWVKFQSRPSDDGLTYKVWHNVSDQISEQQLDEIVRQRQSIIAESQSGRITEAEMISQLEALPKVWYCGELRLEKLNESECELIQICPDWLSRDEKNHQQIVVNSFFRKLKLRGMKAELEARAGQYKLLGTPIGQLNLGLKDIMRDIAGPSYVYDIEKGNGYVSHVLHTGLAGRRIQGFSHPFLEVRVSELPDGGALLDFHNPAPEEEEAYLAKVVDIKEELDQLGLWRTEVAHTRTDGTAQREGHAGQATDRLFHPDARAQLVKIESMWRDGRSDAEIALHVGLTSAGVKYQRQRHDWIDPKRKKHKPRQ